MRKVTEICSLLPLRASDNFRMSNHEKKQRADTKIEKIRAITLQGEQKRKVKYCYHNIENINN